MCSLCDSLRLCRILERTSYRLCRLKCLLHILLLLTLLTNRSNVIITTDDRSWYTGDFSSESGQLIFVKYIQNCWINLCKWCKQLHGALDTHKLLCSLHTTHW